MSADGFSDCRLQIAGVSGRRLSSCRGSSGGGGREVVFEWCPTPRCARYRVPRLPSPHPSTASQEPPLHLNVAGQTAAAQWSGGGRGGGVVIAFNGVLT